MLDDAQLLRRYLADRSEPAFAELVERHLGLVYHSAARQLGADAHLAGDVAQAVFILLAQKADSLADHPSVAGWVHTTTHFKVAEFRRAEQRRRQREAAAQIMNADLGDSGAAIEWEKLRPVLDEALLELNAADREAVLLRYFEGRPFAEIAARLHATEQAAHKRVARALDKLRDCLARRGLTSTSAALATALGAHTALAAPAGLAAVVTTGVASVAAPLVSVATVSFMSTTKFTAVAAALVLVTAGGTVVQSVRSDRAAERDALAAESQTSQLHVQLRDARDRLAQAEREKSAGEALRTQAATTPMSAAATPAPRNITTMMDEGRAFLRANPTVRAAYAASLSASIREEYADLFAGLKLSEADIRRFVEIAAKGRGTIVGRHMFNLDDADPKPAEIAQQYRELLGEEGYLKYRDYSRGAPARDLTRELTQSLYFAAHPLTSVQAEQFKALVAQTLADASVAPRYTGAVWRSIPAAFWTPMIERASGVLSREQISGLQELAHQAEYQAAQTAARMAATRSTASGGAK